MSSYAPSGVKADAHSDLFDDCGYIKPIKQLYVKTEFIAGNKYLIKRKRVKKPLLIKTCRGLTSAFDYGGRELTFIGKFGCHYLFESDSGAKVCYSAIELQERGM